MTYSSLPSLQADLFINPAFAPTEAYGAERARILNRTALDTASQAISRWPGHAQTPLRGLPALAHALGVASLDYKDEGGRFGLGSFKALGGAYAVGRQLCRELERQLGRAVSLDELPALREHCAGITVTCATDGNHGRSVAWGARMFGCRCVIYIHATVSDGRRAAIAAYGAEVVRTRGNYDEAVQQADRDARAQGWFVISDTSYPGYMDVPRDVMQGYQVMVDEAIGQLAQHARPWPTHIFVQAGVGGFAAAVCAYFWERTRPGETPPTFVVVEPERADCLMQSARAGRVTAVTGDLDTLMAGLACGEVSLLAWDILERGTAAFCDISDAAAVAVMRLLAHPLPGDPVIVAGESAVAGLAAAIAIAQNPAQRAALEIDHDSRLLFFGSEADTDPALYEKLVGASAAQIREEAACD
ncbi:MAG: diaminopropionate ammonia-lyase [Proteobacteria bacterium]|nr:diaminopropionate ammonia-lyase [Pseudomonadota bacterium]